MQQLVDSVAYIHENGMSHYLIFKFYIATEYSWKTVIPDNDMVLGWKIMITDILQKDWALGFFMLLVFCFSFEQEDTFR